VSPAAFGAGHTQFSDASPGLVVTDKKTCVEPHEHSVVTQVTDAKEEQGGCGLRVDPCDLSLEEQLRGPRTAEGELLDRLTAHGWEPLGGRDA
jgi:hypothetical protein